MPKVIATQGAILQVNVVNGFDRCMYVIPMMNGGTPVEGLDFCENLRAAAETNLIPLLQAAMAAEGAITGLTVVGMTPGKLPAQEFYSPEEYPGDIVGEVAPSQVSALLKFYGDPDDFSPGNRLRIAKTFLVGVAESAITLSKITGATIGAITAIAEAFIEGLEGADGSVWKRAMRKPNRVGGHPDLEDEIPVAVRHDLQERVRTQKRRLRPD